MDKIQNNQSGAGLLEVLAAVAVFAIGIMTVLHLYSGSFSATTHSIEKNQAILLAREGIEAVRSIRDADFGRLSEDAGGIELENNRWHITTYPEMDIDGRFTREIAIEETNEKTRRVISTVSWEPLRGEETSVVIEEYLTNWREPYDISHTLTIHSGTGGSVTSPGEGTYTYDFGETVDIVAEETDFQGWTGDTEEIDDPSSASTTITILGDYSITATFEGDITHDLTVDSTSGGSVTSPGEGTYNYVWDETVNIVAEPNAGYDFQGWTGDTEEIDDPSSASTTVNMLGDYSITANFTETTHELTIESTSSGLVANPGEGTYTYGLGETVNIVAEGPDFQGWTGDTEEIDDPSSASTTITILGDYSITANFGEVTHDLTVDSTSGGSVTSPGEGTYNYVWGETVDIVAEPNAGYDFQGWTGDTEEIDDPSSASTTITILGDYSITANFTEITHDLTVDSTSGGSVTSPGEGTYNYVWGETVDIVAEPNAGYDFQGWTGDTEEIDDPSSVSTTITILDDYSITASFTEKEYELAVNSTTGGTATDNTNNSPYLVGTVVDINANSSSGYEFVEWTTNDGGSFGNKNIADTTYEMPSNNATITANFSVVETGIVRDSTGVISDGDGEQSYSITNIDVSGMDTMSLEISYELQSGRRGNQRIWVEVDGSEVYSDTVETASATWQDDIDVSGDSNVTITIYADAGSHPQGDDYAEIHWVEYEQRE